MRIRKKKAASKMSDVKFDRIEEKIDKLHDKFDARLDVVNERLDEYNKQLAVHIEGTVQNREIAQKHSAAIEKISSELVVVVNHVNFMQNIKQFLLSGIKVVGVLGTITGSIIAVLKFLKGV